MDSSKARLAVDIGGTFTDVAISLPNAGFVTTKCPTTPDDPVRGAMHGVSLAMERAGLGPADIGSFIHGTTLATNALIERKGATVGVISTQGFRDILEIAYERRYDQYDLYLEKPDMLVPRERCVTISERMTAQGDVHAALDEGSLDDILAVLDNHQVKSLAVCLLHSYANPAHELRLADLIAERRPELSVSLSSQVSPEIREFDRLCTTVANAYIKPLMADYLSRLEQELKQNGYGCPLFIITSGGGMTTLDTAVRFPIRLVESGPSGGAILACEIAKACGRDEVVSFDMGGTTAKICMIDDGTPQSSRHFEIARAARFMKGSGLPVRIPVIEMIEIGAGGGSVSGVDRLGRITVGPESAGAQPGPASYGKGGERATVTDADVALGYIDPDLFAEGLLQLDTTLADTAILRDIGEPLGLDAEESAYGISQIVDENMASAARVHAVERGKSLKNRTMIAFGGNGPLHATRLADKIGVNQIIVPCDPGVGSAIGFLNAPVSYEIVRSLYVTLDAFDDVSINALFAEMTDEATSIVEKGAGGDDIICRRTAFMRYSGQGHEIEVALPDRDLTTGDLPGLRDAYDTAYRQQYHRSVPGMQIEIMNWSLTASTPSPKPDTVSRVKAGQDATATRMRQAYVRQTGRAADVPVHLRHDLAAGHIVAGPALIVEAQTTTFVDAAWTAVLDEKLNIVLSKDGDQGGPAHG